MFKLNRWLAGLVVAVLPATAMASPLTTTHYRLDPDVAGTFGGAGTSPHYTMTGLGGEAATGFGTSSSYRLGAGYIAQEQQSIQLSVLPGGITAYYPLDTGLGVQAYDSSVGAATGVLQNGGTWAAGQIGGALTLNGTTQYVSTTTTRANPTVFSLEVWFKTNTTQGGRLLGLGSSQTGPSATADRQLYLTNTGRVVFGTKPSGYNTVISASSYNDNAWHLAAATLGPGGTNLYIDGQPVAANATTTAAAYTGYWRLGYDDLAGWPSAPTSSYFAGSLDEAKIYSRELGAVELSDEYNAGLAGIVSTQTIPAITPGSSSISSTDVTVRTDGPGYNLAISQDHNLRHTDLVTTIPAIGGTIGTPAAWVEGVTFGLGFGVTAANGLEAKWGTNPTYAYAAVPSLATAFHARTGYTGGAAEVTSLQWRLDTAAAQKSGSYSNQVTISATVKP